MILIYFNAFITIFSLIAILYVIHSFIKPALKCRNQFELYALRDRLATLAMRGKVNEDRSEYKTMLTLILNTISFYEKDFSITSFFAEIIRPQLDKKIVKPANIKKIQDNEHLNAVFIDFFVLLSKKIRKDTLVFRIGTMVLFNVISHVKYVNDSLNNPFKNSFLNAAKKQKNDLEEYENIFIKPVLQFT